MDNLLNKMDPNAVELLEVSEDSFNDCYVILIESQPKFFLKKTTNAAKERLVYDVMKQFSLGNTLSLVYSNQTCLVTEYEPSLVSYNSPYETIKEIARFHFNGLNYNADLEFLLNNSNFYNLDREKAVNRIQRHPELTRNFCSNPDFLIRWIIEKQNLPKDQQKTLIHGDLNLHNLVKSKNLDFIYLDFETALWDYPSWELCRVALDLDNADELNCLAKTYLKHRNIPNSQFKDELAKIKVDCVLRYVSLGLTVQLRDTPHIRQRRPVYLSKIRMLMESITNEI